MRTAVVSDIHGNLEALTEVLTDMTSRRIDRLISLGDNVGYGPDPEIVIGILKELGVPSIMGNHELGIADRSYASWFNPLARYSLEITRRLLSPSSVELIVALQPVLCENRCRFVHGCPFDSISTYLFEVSDRKLASIVGNMGEEICFVGHTHVSELVVFDGKRVEHERLVEGDRVLTAGLKYIVNAGSVGQPRDGDNRARYVIWDDERRSLETRYVAYDIARTAEKILAQGFPRINADRLW